MRCGGCGGSTSNSNSSSSRSSSSSSRQERKEGSSDRHRSLDRGGVRAGPHQRTPTVALGCRTRRSRRPLAPLKARPAHSIEAKIFSIFVFLALLICSCLSRCPMLAAAAAATAVEASAGCSTGTQQGQSGSPQGPMAVPWPVCPVDLLNLIHLQRSTLARSPALASSALLLLDAASGASSSSASSSSCATRLQCGLIRAVLPAATASACAITGATGGDSGSGSDGAALRNSNSAVGRASAAITLTTAGSVGQPASLLQRLEALLDVCAPELALFAALQLAAARAAGQQGADASAEGSAQQQQGLVEDVIMMAAALAACPPLTQETIDACLAQGSTSSSSSSSNGSSSDDGAWGLGPAVAPMDAGDQCLPAAAVVSPEVWSLTGAWYQAAPSSSPGAAAGGSLNGISGGVSAASGGAGGASRGGITWRAGCSCTQDWAPVCDVVTGQQYPNACFASCLVSPSHAG